MVGEITKNGSEEGIEEVLKKSRAQIKVFGCGGAGGNTIDRMVDTGIEDVGLVALNTDAQDLLKIKAHKKIIIGKETTRGLGAGANIEIGEAAARENEREIKEAMDGAHLIFVACGLGGGTGTGSAPVVADIAKKSGALTVGIVTLPFEMEGHHRWQNARAGMSKLETVVDTLIVVPNQKLLKLAPDLPIGMAFKLADEVLVNGIRGISEMITKPGLVNMDFADLRTIMKDSGVALMGFGESTGDNRAEQAARKALNNPLLDVDIAGAKSALISITGGPDFTLEEARQVVSTVTEKLDAEANIIWGHKTDENLKNGVRVLLVITGAQPMTSMAFHPGKQEIVEGLQREVALVL